MRIGNESLYSKPTVVLAERAKRGAIGDGFERELGGAITIDRQSDNGVSRFIEIPDDREPYRVTDPSSLAKINIFDKATADQAFSDFLKLAEDARAGFKAGLQVFIDSYEAIIKANPSARNELQPLIDTHKKILRKQKNTGMVRLKNSRLIGIDSKT